jgi:hypothetical protein
MPILLTMQRLAGDKNVLPDLGVVRIGKPTSDAAAGAMQPD